MGAGNAGVWTKNGPIVNEREETCLSFVGWSSSSQRFIMSIICYFGASKILCRKVASSRGVLCWPVHMSIPCSYCWSNRDSYHSSRKLMFCVAAFGKDHHVCILQVPCI